MKNFFIKMFTAHSGLSSKRVCGLLGWLVCLFICIWCTIYVIPAPEIVQLLFICSTSLLGIDSIVGIICILTLQHLKQVENMLQ